MRVLTIVHERDAGPGVFTDVFAASGTDVDTWLVAEEPEPAPPMRYDAILTFGGAQHPDEEDRYPWLATEERFLADALRERVPLLGVCLGAELIAKAQRTATRRMARPEIGWYDVELTAAGKADPILAPAGSRFRALEWHSHEVMLPSSATALGHNGECLQAFRIGNHAWGLQFHAEVTAEDFRRWLGEDSDAVVAAGIDPAGIAAETDQRIEAWNELGRGICERFLRIASIE